MAKVALIKCENYENEKIYHSIKKAINEIGGIEKFISRKDRVLIKPNLLRVKSAERAVTTHPVFILQVVKILREYGVDEIIVGDSPGVGNVFNILQKIGILEELKRLKVKVVNLDTPLEVNGKGILKKLEVSDIVKNVDKIISLPKIKTHTLTYLSGAIKNMYGIVPGMQKTQWHLRAGFDTEHFLKILISIYLTVKPTLNICDAVVGMEGNGPSIGTPRNFNFIGASEDAYSLDKVVCDILKIDETRRAWLKVAHELMSKEDLLSDIIVVGDKIDKIENLKKPAASFEIGRFFYTRKFLKNYLTPNPVIDKNKCDHCKTCATHCPAKCIEIGETQKIDYKKCIRCFCCSELCPRDAIEVKKGNLLFVFDIAEAVLRRLKI